MIENGKIGAPLKGAMLIGNGPTDLHRITHDRQRSCARHRHRHLRQERPGRAGRRRPADAADGTDHRRRHRRMSVNNETMATKKTSTLARPARPAHRHRAGWSFSPRALLAEPFYVPSALDGADAVDRRCAAGIEIRLRLLDAPRCRSRSIVPETGACSARRRSAAMSWCSAGRATARRPGSSASLASPATASRCAQGAALDQRPCGRAEARRHRRGRRRQRQRRSRRFASSKTLPGGVSHQILKLRDRWPARQHAAKSPCRRAGCS